MRFPDFSREKNDIFAKAYKEGEVLNSEILNEFVDILFEISHESSFQSSFGNHLDGTLEELLFGQPSDDRQVIDYVESCHVFYDPVEEYMERLGNGNGQLYLYYKDQFLYYNFVPLDPSVLFFIKHEEKVGLWDHLLEWLHWK